jgi:hypothetical protein
MPQPQPRDATFLIIAGVVTALFLPFALAFPPTLLEKLIATAALVAIACGVAALVIRFRRR